MVRAVLRDTSTHGYEMHHGTDREIVAAMVAAIEAGAELPPVLVAEWESSRESDLLRVLDGHHRLQAAAQCGLPYYDAWVIDGSDLDALLDEHFDGQLPDRLSDLDMYVRCDGREYGLRA